MILSSTGWWLRIYSHQPSRPGSRNGGCPPAQSSAARGASTKLRSSIRGWGRVNSGVESRKLPHQSRSRSRLRGPSARGAGDQNAAPDHAGRPAIPGPPRLPPQLAADSSPATTPHSHKTADPPAPPMGSVRNRGDQRAAAPSQAMLAANCRNSSSSCGRTAIKVARGSPRFAPRAIARLPG